MAMNFFEHQQAARRNSRQLVWLFAAAVAGVILAVHASIGVTIALWLESGSRLASDLLDERILALSAVVVLIVVGCGSISKTLSLRSGGRALPEMLGARRLRPQSVDLPRRKLLNVVDEMAIASGMPVPPVYELNEDGINSFAAGYSLTDAVVSVTQGGIEKLSRDELQGVVAHEFSHILNGDMRLNMRLIGLIHGILVLGLMGRFILRMASRSSSGSRRGKKGGKGVPPLVALGAMLALIGLAGTFFAGLIKAAINRQREFLADASAVQFTRNPRGIAGALQKIRKSEEGSRLKAAQAEEVSHMLFSMGTSGWLASLSATHPPLDERIQRLEPEAEGIRSRESGIRKRQKERVLPETEPLVQQTGKEEGAFEAPRPSAPAISGLAALSLAGNPRQEHMEQAQEMIARLPQSLRSAAREPYAARAVIYALLLDEKEEVRKAQMESLEEAADPDVLRELRFLSPHVRQLEAELRLPLAGLATASLDELSAGQYQEFRRNLERLIAADERVSLFEWCLRRVVLGRLEPLFSKAAKAVAKRRRLNQLGHACSVLLSRLAYCAEAQTEDAFRAGAAVLALPDLRLLTVEQCSLARLDEALRALDGASASDKQSILRACAAAIAQDRQVSLQEGELFRALASSLGCPVPPLLEGQKLA